MQCVGMPGVDRQRTIVAFERIRIALEFQQRIAAIRPGGGIGRLDGQRLIDQFDGLLRLAALAGDHAEQLQCTAVPGAGLQDFAVQRFGGIELSLLMQLEGLLQLLSRLPTLYQSVGSEPSCPRSCAFVFMSAGCDGRRRRYRPHRH